MGLFSCGLNLLLCSVVVWGSEDGLWFAKTCFKFPAVPETIARHQASHVVSASPGFLKKEESMYFKRSLGDKMRQFIGNSVKPD